MNHIKCPESPSNMRTLDSTAGREAMDGLGTPPPHGYASCAVGQLSLSRVPH